ncbi:hypothetical protein RhiirA4_390476 [Rhizophagus irregularis]|uniref:Uncharacterized protein n=1 Tax=Rhizophagus irregularis TaxID=588596 RepID=A0A2I1FSZ4_9GLOM|nr:hypothetical protein RhiirA4_390476 [Rhizophagus irregularis]
MTPTWDSIGPIDRDLRKFARNITECRVFDEFLTSTAIPTISLRFDTLTTNQRLDSLQPHNGRL